LVRGSSVCFVGRFGVISFDSACTGRRASTAAAFPNCFHSLCSAACMPPSVPLDGRSAPGMGRSANKERTPLPRAGWSCVSPSLASHPQVFHGGCFGVYGTPPREAVWFCKIGTKIPLVPRLGVGTLRILWLSWLTFGWRVQTCSQVLAWCLKTAPPGVCLAAWPRYRLQSMPGFFRAVRGCGGQAADGFKRVG